VGALAGRYTWPRLHEAYRLILDADLSVKRGLQDDESALQLLVHELCALAPSGSTRPSYAR
jgi:DNA polymerase III delta subunit